MRIEKDRKDIKRGEGKRIGCGYGKKRVWKKKKSGEEKDWKKDREGKNEKILNMGGKKNGGRIEKLIIKEVEWGSKDKKKKRNMEEEIGESKEEEGKKIEEGRIEIEEEKLEKKDSKEEGEKKGWKKGRGERKEREIRGEEGKGK